MVASFNHYCLMIDCYFLLHTVDVSAFLRQGYFNNTYMPGLKASITLISYGVCLNFVLSRTLAYIVSIISDACH